LRVARERPEAPVLSLTPNLGVARRRSAAVNKVSRGVRVAGLEAR
jgi:hypothetical protein